MIRRPEWDFQTTHLFIPMYLLNLSYYELYRYFILIRNLSGVFFFLGDLQSLKIIEGLTLGKKGLLEHKLPVGLSQCLENRSCNFLTDTY